MAQLEFSLGVRSSYYFRVNRNVYKEELIKGIFRLGHEVGYHYETMDTCRGRIEEAIKEFRTNLNKIRELVSVSTICRHGSPRSKWDNGDLWKTYDYRSLGILGEPYIDVDFSKVLYLTDTGRRWDGAKVSVRDKVAGSGLHRQYRFVKTPDIARALADGRFPDQAMLTVHPQRWRDDGGGWTWEYARQRLKNVVKRFVAR